MSRQRVRKISSWTKNLCRKDLKCWSLRIFLAFGFKQKIKKKRIFKGFIIQFIFVLLGIPIECFKQISNNASRTLTGMSNPIGII